MPCCAPWPMGWASRTSCTARRTICAGTASAPPRPSTGWWRSAGGPVGVCLWFPAFSTFRGEPGLYVQDLYVAPSERGTGLGRRLLAAAAADGRAQGATHLRLSVESGNDGAQRFYAASGLRWQDTERIFLADGRAFDTLADGIEETDE